MAETPLQLLPGCSTFTDSLALILSSNNGQLPNAGEFVQVKGGTYSMRTITLFLIAIQKELAQHLKPVVQNTSLEAFLEDEKKILDDLSTRETVDDESWTRLHFQQNFVQWLEQIRELQLKLIPFSDEQWETMQLGDYALTTMELFGSTREKEIDLIHYRSRHWKRAETDPVLKSVYDPIFALYSLCRKMPDKIWK